MYSYFYHFLPNVLVLHLFLVMLHLFVLIWCVFVVIYFYFFLFWVFVLEVVFGLSLVVYILNHYKLNHWGLKKKRNLKMSAWTVGTWNVH